MPVQYQSESDFWVRNTLNLCVLPTGSKPFVPKRLLTQWHVTEKCNLSCQHCYQSSQPFTQEMSFDDDLQVLSGIVSLLKEWGVRGHINFTGGEPFLKSSFMALLRKVYEHRNICGFAVLTNGSLIDVGMAKELKRLGCRFVQVSLDGNSGCHDQIRGGGNFQKTVDAIKILRRQRLRVLVSFTAHRKNIDGFSELADVCQKLGVDMLWSDRLLPHGRGEAMRDELLTPCELEAFFETMYQANVSLDKRWFNKTTVGMHRALQFLVLKKHGHKDAVPYTCHAGRSLLTILPSGQVLPCRRMPIVVGDLKQESLGQIYYKSVLLRQLRNRQRITEGCEPCEHATLCNGGLRCMAYAYHGTPFKADPQCFKIYNELPVQTKEKSYDEGKYCRIP
ncbi:MAG: radical SAM protein [Candidatus Omnitrophota bacterium]